MSQRDYTKIYIEKLNAPTNKDIIKVEDLDEILTREGIKYVIKYPTKYFYFLKWTIYILSLVQSWDKGLVVKFYKPMKTLSKY